MKRLRAIGIPLLLILALLAGMLPMPANGAEAAPEEQETPHPEEVVTVTEQVLGGPLALLSDLAPPELEEAPEYVNASPYTISGSAPFGAEVILTMRWADHGSYTYRGTASEPLPEQPELGAFAIPVGFSHQGVHEWSAYAELDGLRSEDSAVRRTIYDSVATNAPFSVRISEGLYNQLVLEWDPPFTESPGGEAVPDDSVDHYTITRNGELVDTTTDLFYVDSGLEETTFYTYGIRAVDKAGNISPPYPARMATFHRYAKLIAEIPDWAPYRLQKPVLSKDGGTLVFVSDAPDLPGASEGGKPGIYTYKSADDSISRIDDTNLYTERVTRKLAVSSDGRYLAYIKHDGLPGQENVRFYDHTTREMTAVTETSVGAIFGLSMSGDGSKLAFITDADNLVPGDEDGKLDVFLYTRPDGGIVRLPMADDSGRALEDPESAVLSGDGRQLFFQAKEVWEPGSSGYPHSEAFVYDVASGEVKPLGIETASGEPLGISQISASHDGRYLALIASQGFQPTRAYIHDREAATTSPVYAAGGLPGDIYMNWTELDDEGRYALVHYTNRDSMNDPAAGPFNTRTGVIRFDWRTQEFRHIGNRSRATTEASISGDGERAAFLMYKSLYTVCLAEECPDAPPPDPGIDRVLVSVQAPVNGHIPMEGKLNIAAFGAPDGVLAAVIGYLNQSGVEQEARVPLPEDAGHSGVYRGTWQLPPEVRTITAIRAESVRDPNVRLEADAALPIRVAGELEVALTSAHLDTLAGSFITAHSPSGKGAAGTVIDGRSSYRLTLPEGSDYQLRVMNLLGTQLLELGPLVIANGERTTVEAALEPTATLKVRMEQSAGEAYRGGEVVFVNEATEEAVRTRADRDGYHVLTGRHFAGEQWRIEPQVHDPYASPVAELITLVPGDNVRIYPLALQPDGAVQGVIRDKDDRPVAGAKVKLILTWGGETASVLTDSEGRYRLSHPRGRYKLVVEPVVPPFNTEAAVMVDLVPGTEQTRDFTMIPLEKARINLEVMQKRLQEDWTRVPIRNPIVYSSYNVSITSSNGYYVGYTQVVDNAVTFDGKPGDRLKVCIDGVAYGMTSSCASAVLDGYNEATVRLEMEEGARITGSIASYNLGDAVQLTTHLYDGGWRTISQKAQISSSGRFEIPLREAGLIRMSFRKTTATGTTTTTLEREVGEGSIIDLGAVALRGSADLFYGLEGNGLDVRGEALPGETIAVHGSYRLQPRPERTLHDARLRIEVPSGTTLLEDSVVLGTVQVQVERVSESVYEVPIGSLTAGSGGGLSYRLKLDPSLTAAVHPALHMVYRASQDAEPMTELIGTSRVAPVQLTLIAPERSNRAAIPVSGRAPAGSEVVIYAGGSQIGMATASPGGLWRAEVKLPARADTPLWGDRYAHRLVATTGEGEDYIASRPVFVSYDPSQPVMTEISMMQADGREHRFDPVGGVARFPFVVAPYKAIRFRINFNHPERVTNVKVSLDHTSYRAYYDPEQGYFESYVQISKALSSPVYVSYDPVPPSPQPAPVAVSEEAIQAATARLPEAWSKAEYAVVDDAEAASALGPDAVRPAGPGEYRSEVIRTTMGNPDRYVGYTQLTAKRVRGASGPRPYRDVSTEMSATDEGVLVTVRATFDEAFLTGASSSKMADGGGHNKDDVDQVVIALSTLYDSKSVKALDMANNFRSYVTDMDDFFDYAEELLKFQDEIAYTECHAPSRQHYHEMTELLYNQAQNGLVIKNGITGLSLIISAVEKVPAWLGFSSSQVLLNLGTAAKNAWYDRLNELKADFKNNQEWRDRMAAAGAIDRCRTPDAEELPEELDERRERPDKVAEPVWIWDPSGYVYEAVPGNRLEGVQAVLYELQQDTGQWLQWDAEWYLQQNPLHTDKQGRYGWDVPEGVWKVRYEKEGYEPAESEELTVLPPHFDVNIPMTSRKPPTVIHADGADTPAIDLTFSKPMLAASVRAELIRLLDEGGLPVTGTVSAVSPEPMADGRLVATGFRFTPSAPLTAGSTYQLTVLPEVLSYADVPMTSPYASEVIIRESGAPPPEHVQQLDVIPGSRELIAKWQATESPAASGLRLYWRQIEGEFGTPVELAAGDEFYVLRGLEAGEQYEVKLVTIGAGGVESTGISVEKATLAEPDEPSDSTPPSEVSRLTVQRAGTQALQLTWQDPADADLRSVRIVWRKKGESVYGSSVSVPAGEQRLRIEDLSVNTDYEFLIHTLDHRMNRSAGLTAEGSTRQPAGPPPPGGPPPGPQPGGPPRGEEPGEKPGDPDPQEPPPGAGAASEEVQVGAAASTWSGFDGRVALEIAAGTFADGQRLQVRRLQSGEAPLPTGMRVYSDLFRIEAEGLGEFERQLRMFLAYDEEQANKLDLRKLSLFRYEEDSRSWTYVGGVKEPGERRIVAAVRQPGVYAILSAQTAFADLQGHWARESVEVLAARTIVNGRRPDGFEPSGMLTRAELAKLLVVMNGGAAAAVTRGNGQEIGTGRGDDAGASFADVPGHAWYASYVRAAAAAGWMQGSGNTFRPDERVTRQELAAVFVRLLGMEDRASEAMRELQARGAAPGFKDGKAVSGWAAGYVEIARLTRLMQGDTDGAFRPVSGTSRAEAATLLLRAMGQLGLVDQAR